MLSLDIGCGQKRLGTLGMDITPGPNVDVVHDMTQLPWPFPNEHFDELFCSHVLEHLPWQGLEDHELIFLVMAEMHRILKKGGVAHVSVPHEDSPFAAGIPTHRRLFNEFSFTYFAGPQLGREARPSWDRPLFTSMTQRVDRYIGLPLGYNDYHLQKHVPLLYRAACFLHIGRKGNIHVDFVK